MPQLLRCCCMHDSQNENGEVSCINTGQKGSLCVNGEAPNSCSQGCAISMNQFTTDCVSTLNVIMPLGNDHHNQIDAFANACLASLSGPTLSSSSTQSWPPRAIPDGGLCVPGLNSGSSSSGH